MGNPPTAAFPLLPNLVGVGEREENRKKRLAADGSSEGQAAIGNVEAMTLYSQAADINEIGTTCAPPSQNSIDHQRIPFNLRDEARKAVQSNAKGKFSAITPARKNHGSSHKAQEAAAREQVHHHG
jgi:Protein of unknown function (DUF4043)